LASINDSNSPGVRVSSLLLRFGLTAFKSKFFASRRRARPNPASDTALPTTA
jgi:hypothetical protein